MAGPHRRLRGCEIPHVDLNTGTAVVVGAGVRVSWRVVGSMLVMISRMRPTSTLASLNPAMQNGLYLDLTKVRAQ